MHVCCKYPAGSLKHLVTEARKEIFIGKFPGSGLCRAMPSSSGIPPKKGPTRRAKPDEEALFWAKYPTTRALPYTFTLLYNVLGATFLKMAIGEFTVGSSAKKVLRKSKKLHVWEGDKLSIKVEFRQGCHSWLSSWRVGASMMSFLIDFSGSSAIAYCPCLLKRSDSKIWLMPTLFIYPELGLQYQLSKHYLDFLSWPSFWGLHSSRPMGGHHWLILFFTFPPVSFLWACEVALNSHNVFKKNEQKERF